MRKQQLEETLDCTQEIKNIIVGGIFNFEHTSDEFKVMSKAGLVDIVGQAYDNDVFTMRQN